MALCLITGPANSAKAGEVLGRYRAAADRSPILVVPSWLDVVTYRRELAQSGCVFGGDVVLFDGLIQTIANRCSYSPNRISDQGRRLILQAVVEQCELKRLATSAQTDGFLSALSHFIAELQRSLIAPTDLSSALQIWSAQYPGSSEYAGEVARIYERYRMQVDEHAVVDRDLFAWRALDRLRSQPQNWRQTPVFLYGFDDLTAVERDAVETLARVVDADVAVALTYEGGREALKSRSATVELLEPLAREHLQLAANAEYYAPAARTALYQLERNLFETNALEQVNSGDAVQLLVSGSDRCELELVATQLRALIDRGTAPEQIAVVFRFPDRYRLLLAQVFDAYNIPFSMSWSTRFDRTALGNGFVALLRCALVPDAGSSELVTYLRSYGVLDHPHLADQLELQLRRDNVLTAAEAYAIWQERRWKLDSIDRLEAAVGDGTIGLLTESEKQLAWLFARGYRREARPLTPAEHEDAAALTAVTTAIREYKQLLDISPGLIKSVDQLIAQLAMVSVDQRIEPAADRVQVVGPLAIRARRYRHVFICGLQAGEFPYQAQSNPFFSTSQRREIAGCSGLVLPGNRDLLADEQALFYACASRPEERLYLSYRVTDEAGGPVARSGFIDASSKSFANDLEDAALKRPLTQVTWSSSFAPTPFEQARALAAEGPRVEAKSLTSLATSSALDQIAQQTSFSAAALETYLACPIRWLVERRLRPQSLVPDSDSLQRGSLAHRLLQKLMDGLRNETGSAQVTSETLRIAQQLLVETIKEEAVGVELASHPVAATAELQRLERDISRYLEYQASLEIDLEPTYFEWEFGLKDSDYPPMDLADGDFQVNGRVDRIDIKGGQRQAIIVDYKATAAHPGASWERDNRLQVALYMLAVKKLMGLNPVGGLYQPLTGKDLRGRGVINEIFGDSDGFVSTDYLSATEIDQLLERVEAEIVSTIKRLRSGELTSCPDSCSANGCLYPTICRSGG